MTGSNFPDDLERRLAHLADDAIFPPTPDFTTITAGSSPPTARRFPWWKIAIAAAAVLAIAVVSVPDAREAVADWLGFPGIRIEIGDHDDDLPDTVTSIGGSLLLGDPGAIDDIQAQVDFPVLVPGTLSAVTPETYLNEQLGPPVVSLLYPPSGDLPEIGTTGVGLLLMEIDASGDTSMFIVKRAALDALPRSVSVNGRDGMWIQGGMLVTDAGDPFWTYMRRSGNVLVWEQDGITYRMESDLPLNEAIAIAESLEPVVP